MPQHIDIGMETEIDREIRAWAMSEVLPWRMRHLPKEAFSATAARSRATIAAFVVCIRKGAVSIESKAREFEHPDAKKRCQMYLGLFEAVLRVYPSIPDTMFILDIGDMPPPCGDTPIFQFQKPYGSSAILLPDIDFLGLDFYHQPGYADKIPYQEKTTSAIFVGGTSGQTNTVETVREPVAPRLQAGKHFRGHPDINFLLTTLSRCENAEAEQALRDLGFGGPTVPWSEQFPHKFIISVDGNGATCSRVVIALKSNSALLKYDSPHHLYYFKGLVPWLHYVPIVEHGDIENIIKIEREYPGTFASIAEEGRRFAETYITRQRVFQYVAELLTLYAVLVYPMNDSDHPSTIMRANDIALRPQLSLRTLDEIDLETGTDKSSLHSRSDTEPQAEAEQQPIGAMDFLRRTPGQLRAHERLPVEPEPVREGRIRKLLRAIFG
jgi:Glycosyl transferase family 90